MDKTQQNGYFAELTICLRQTGFGVLPSADDLLPIEKDGQPLCRVASDGSVRYYTQDVATVEREHICNQVMDIATITAEYMKLMEKAPVLKVDGLNETYKLLADFNGTVLAGHPTEYGVQFVTWEWSYGGTSLWQGHYYGNNYEAAKQDFAVRSQLIQAKQLFTDEQFAEVYRCIHETLESDYPITSERQRLLVDTAEQIEYAVPQLDELVNQSNLKEMEVADGATYQGMTQPI